jgi:hypothetical protein
LRHDRLASCSHERDQRSARFIDARSPASRRVYALDEDQAWELRLTPEFAGEELTDPEISRLIGIYRSKLTRVLRFAA